MIPFLTREACEPLLNWRALTDALLDAHRLPRADVRDTLLSQGEGKLLSRAAWIEGIGVGVKSVTVFGGNPARGLPTVNGAMIVFDPETGMPRAILDNALITRWKTAGDSVLGARLLARPDARRLLIVGAGTVAASLIEAYGAVFEGIEITLWARRPEAAQALAAAYPGVQVAADLPAAVAQADIIATCTMARAPVIMGDWLRPGQHLDLIGAYTPDMREADDTAVTRARLFTDSRATSIGHIGEFMQPMAAGVITAADIIADYYDLAASPTGTVHRAPDDITLFKNAGGAHLDLMTARYIIAATEAAT